MKIYGAHDGALALSEGRVTVAVYGLGKMGLPLASVIADRGAKVIGVDVNSEVVAQINDGRNHVVGEPSLDELVERNVKEGRMTATTDGELAARSADVMIMIVPVLVDGDKKADLGMLRDAARTISKGLEKGDFVIVETTVPPGTTRNEIAPILEESGLKVGVDFGLAHCPERTSSGRAIMDIKGAYPKIVGGVDPESTRTAEQIYRVINDRGVIPVSDSSTSEMVKIAEGLYRDVNIALANELALVSRQKEVNVWEVIEAANTQPYCDIHRPGPGVGGHCIPVYPWFVINGDSTRVIRTAREVNEGMPGFVVDRVVESIQGQGKDIRGSNVLVAGLVFRPGVKETAHTPAREVIKGLRSLGANIFGYDPLLNENEMRGLLGVESPNGERIDCTVYLHNRDYQTGKKSQSKITPVSMFR